jgi:poly(3-hydroxybutyrate) depolymerase
MQVLAFWGSSRGRRMYVLSLVAAISTCRQISESRADPAPAGLRSILERDGEWLEHPTAGFRFRHPGPTFQLESRSDPRSSEQTFVLTDVKNKIVLVVDVNQVLTSDDKAVLREVRTELDQAGPGALDGQRHGLDFDDIIDGPPPVLRAWGHLAGAPMAMRAMVVQSSATERHLVALMAVGILPEQLAPILDSLRPSAGQVPPVLSLDQLRLRYPQLRRMRVPPRTLPPDPPPPPPPPPPPGIELVHYSGPAGKLSAYLHTPKDRKHRHPAVLWCHGGFGGVDDSQWRFNDRTRGEVGPLFADNDFVVLSPAWRGEAGSDGMPEIYWGEVDDALASIDYLSKLDFVDPARIYVAGHSSGATIAAFVGQRTARVQAVFAFGASLHNGSLKEDGWELTFPFDATNVAAAWFRSPLAGVADTKVPTFWFEGSKNSWGAVKTAAEQMAERAHVPFHAFVLPDRDHWTAVPPMARLVIAKLAALKPGVQLEITQADVITALAADRPKEGLQQP